MSRSTWWRSGVLLLLLGAGAAVRADEKRVDPDGLDFSGFLDLRPDLSAFDDVYPAGHRDAKLKEFNPADGGTVGFEVYDLGAIAVRTGKLAVFDPTTFSGGSFAKEVPKGDYPVLLATRIHREGAHGAKTVRQANMLLFARVELAARPAVRWELAQFDDAPTGDGQKPRSSTGYASGSGLGAFADSASRTAFEQAGDPVSEKVDAQLRRVHGQGVTARTWAKVTLGEAEMARFGSFGGDGNYKSYWGYDRNDKLVALLTDFSGAKWVGKPTARK